MLKSGAKGSGAGPPAPATTAVPAFDFDFWSNLARTDPQRFFRERERAIRQFIDDAPPLARDRLTVLQAHIDGMRATAGTPQAAVRAIFALLDDHLGALGGRLAELHEHTERLRTLADRIK